MFRRGNSTISLAADGAGLRLWPRPIMHVTSLCWMGVTGLLKFATDCVTAGPNMLIADDDFTTVDNLTFRRP